MKYINNILFLVSVICIFLLFKTSDEPFVFQNNLSFLEKFSLGNVIIYDLAMGMLVSIFFYFLVVLLPGKAKKNRIKKNFISQYQEFRKQLVSHVLGNSGEPYFVGLTNELTDVKKFRQYFNERITESQNRWFAFSNNITNQSLSDILLEFETLQEAITILLINIDVQDEEVFSLLHRIRTITVTQKNVRVEDYNSFRYLLRLLWEILAGFSVDGYREYDYFEKMFERI